ncbi:MAG: bifunctional phosphoribosylaminoimidazolecarboxamide formyltransferase/IMP cyclohydrolase [Actinobacteria bacterium]|nr:bifunctional phosphoribosylaminoimidazolecarboxamide formyltransferase/IMP cyclohydrolase [Actinomycetota bacterium]
MSNRHLRPRRALISVYDKTGLPALAYGLHAAGVELVSTGSTARVIADAGVPVTAVSDVTGFPEILDGRVKTLHPAVHAGILADRSQPGHADTLAAHGIAPIDLVVSNLYPFEQTVADPHVADAQVIEMIDIGGPTMVRAAAKNHAHVAVVVDPADYAMITALVDDGGVDAATRRSLAAKAFTHTAAYDAAVAGWFAGDRARPDTRIDVWHKVSDLRYGENPHQSAAFYRPAVPTGLTSAPLLQGKALSYTNLLDADAAWRMATAYDEPCVAVIKHTNPTGIAIAETLAEAYPAALAGDPVSAFGGIVGANREIDVDTARQIIDVFTEVVVAPAFSDAAREVFAQRRNLRLLEVATPSTDAVALQSVAGGLLVQALDLDADPADEWHVVTTVAPTDDQRAALAFAWQTCGHVKSNAIVLAQERAIVGVGAGQMSRVDSVELAVRKAGDRAKGAVLASDAFFPFRDGPDAAIAAGVSAIIQPGGSKRDDETIAACDEHGVAMIFTGRRHFRH